MKNSIILLLLFVGFSFTACQSESTTTDAVNKPSTSATEKADANKFDASKAQATSPLKQPQNKAAVDAAKQTVKGSGKLPAKAIERRNKIQLKNQNGLLQQRKDLKKLNPTKKPLIKKQ